MTDSPQNRVGGVLFLAASLLLILLVVHLLGCEGAPGPGVGSIYGYAYLCDSSIICTCSATPPSGCTPASGYLVYIDDTSGPPDATCGANGYWSVTGVRVGRHTVYVCPPGGPPGCLAFRVAVLGGMWRCTPSHEAGGGP